VKIPGGGERIYEVSGVLMKEKFGEGKLNIASRFELLTRKKDIAMVVDASGGLSMTSILDSDLTPLPTQKMNFYIIENIENDSDSATKLKNFDRPKTQANIAVQPNLFFLKDDIDTILYPQFQLLEGKQDGEMLFGNADLVLSRAGDEMEADFTFPDGKTYHIENVSQNANVKNASLNIVASTLAKGGKVSKERGIETADGDKTPYLFPYIKRAGDWCQALSLLDGARKYSKLDQDHKNTVEKTTLDDLRKAGAAIGLLTLDRILLGYALALGIDVFFTTAPDLRLLLYFRNTEAALDPAELTRQVGILAGEVAGEYTTIGKDNVGDVLTKAIQDVKAATSPSDYILKLRGALYRISLLRTDFAVLTAKVQELLLGVGGVQKPGLSDKEKYDMYFEAKTILRRLKSDEKHNETQKTSLATYPDLVDERQQLDLINRRPQSRGSVEKIRVVVTKAILNDAKQTKAVFDKYKRTANLKEFMEIGAGVIAGTPVEARAVYTDILKSLNEVRSLFGAAPQIGGAVNTDSLRQFIVTPVRNIAEYEAVANNIAQAVQADTDVPLPLVLGSYYRDKKSFPYTVVDQYIITKEDLPTFTRISAGGFDVLPAEQQYVATRLIILYLDILQGQLERLKSSDYDNAETVTNKYGVKTTQINPSDINISENIRIYYKASQLLKIYNDDISTGQFKTAVEQAIQVNNETDAKDNATILATIVGADALRNPREYTRTFEKIKTVRNAILRLPPYTGFSAPIAAPAPREKRGREGPGAVEGAPIKKQVIPAPPPPGADVSIAESGAAGEGVGGGLRAEDGISTNVEGIDIPGVRSRKHSRLRKRARTRRARRIRKSARKSKTRR